MRKLFFSLTLLMFTASFLTAQEVTVEDIVTTYLENIGGEDAWREVKSMKTTGTASAQGMQMMATMYAMEPNMMKLEIDVQGMKMIQPSFDGETAWTLNPFAGGEPAPQKMSEEETAELKKEMFQNAFIDYAKKGSTVELLGTKEIEGEETYEVKLTTKDGTEKFYYFEQENFVPIMQMQVMEVGQMKGTAIESYMSDYQEIEGTELIAPFSMEQKVGEMTAWQMSMEKIEINPEDVTKTTFAFPEDK